MPKVHIGKMACAGVIPGNKAR